jgi:hypothetical protein
MGRGSSEVIGVELSCLDEDHEETNNHVAIDIYRW